MSDFFEKNNENNLECLCGHMDSLITKKYDYEKNEIEFEQGNNFEIN
jgi:hypothetical protein